jgi:YidC/Oxa1 family membrane protein insertase
MADQRKSSILQFVVVFAMVYLGAQFAVRTFFPPQENALPGAGGIALEMQDPTVKGDHEAIVIVHNSTDTELTLPDRCPMPPFDVWKVEGEQRVPLTATGTAIPCVPLVSVPANGKITYSLLAWKYSLFADYGTYELELPAEGAVVAPTPGQEGSQYREGIITRFSIHEAGVFTQTFRAFITKPLLNLLILIASLTPGYNLGVAIILLTILIKLLLFLPTQHALEGQKKLQLLQPKLEEIRRKYKDDPKKMNEETMALWKREKVNPFQSCLPMLLQFPILIGLFFVIRDGSVLEVSRHLLYTPYLDLPWQFGHGFLGLDLTKSSHFIFPPILVILQFLQMKLSFAIAKRKKSAAKDGKKEKDPEADQMQAMQQKMMTYMLPLMIGFFSFQVPDAVSLYWGISTLFAIGQQIIVNREHITTKA